MKRIFLAFILILSLSMILTVTVSAGPYGVKENPPIDVYNYTPVIDGVINEDEGWSVSALMNFDTLGFYWRQQPLTTDGNVRFAWDDDNLYYCANIVEGLSAVRETDGRVYEEGYNQFVYSTGEDWIDMDYGFDGDVFCLIIDPLGTMLYDAGFVGNEDYTPWYLIGLFEGDVAKMHREKINVGDITDQVQVKGHKTEKGWCFEAAIPWDMILKDVEDISFGECVVTKEQVLTHGALVRAGAMYQDRFIDPESGEVATWGRYLTAPTDLINGWQGQDSSGPNVLTLGINLYITRTGFEDTTVTTDNTTTDPTGTEQQATDTVLDEQGNVVTDDSGNPVTQKSPKNTNNNGKSTTKAANKGSTTGETSAQTFDIGIAVALGALVTSGVGFVASRKRK